MASRMFNRGMYEMINQTTNFDTGSIIMMLMTSAYSFDPDSDFVSDISANELSTTNYARQTLANTTITLDDTNDRVVLDADDVTINNLGPSSGGPTVGGAITERSTGVDSTSPLICFSDFTDTVVNGGNFTVQWSVNGLITATSP
jgi:hypothetical protein